MTTTTWPQPRRRGLGFRGTVRTYRLEVKYELLKLLRMPAFIVPMITFPAMFYLLFGVGFGSGRAAGAVNMATYLLATYAAFGVVGSGLFGFGVGIAMERGQGWMLLKRATPMPIPSYFVAKLAASVVFGAAVVVLLGLLAVTLGGVRLDAGTWASLIAVLVLGALPFCALGLLLGYLVGPNAAPALINLVYLPGGFLSGMWIPIPVLPRLVQKIAPFVPHYHFSQLALGRIGADQGGSPWGHAAVLAGSTLVFLVLARFAYLRDDGRTFG